MPGSNEAISVLSSTRPTAVNLFNALERMRRSIETAQGTGVFELLVRLRVEAMVMYREDVESCRRISELGAELIAPGLVRTHPL